MKCCSIAGGEEWGAEFAGKHSSKPVVLLSSQRRRGRRLKHDPSSTAKSVTCHADRLLHEILVNSRQYPPFVF